VARRPENYFSSDNIEPNFTMPKSPIQGRSVGSLLKIYPILASMGILICFQGVRMSLVPLLTYILQAKGYSLTLGSIMVGAMGLGMILVSSPIGHVGDRWSRKKPLLLAILVGMICAILIPLVSSLVLLFILLAAFGAAFATALTMTRVIITDVTNSEERGSAMALNSIAIGIAVIIFPTIASYILELRGWSAIAWTGAILMGLAFLQIIYLREKGIGEWNHRGC
jgi:MFS family permease